MFHNKSALVYLMLSTTGSYLTLQHTWSPGFSDISLHTEFCSSDRLSHHSELIIFLFQTLLVTGGWTGSVPLSSTELLVGEASAWVLTGELPSPRDGLHGANIDNRILMTGGKYVQLYN